MIEIGVELATSHAFGRQFAEGLAAYAAKHTQWRLRPIDLEGGLSSKILSSLDGAVLRILDDTIERRVRQAGLPVVDIYCGKNLPGLAQVRTDDERIGQLAAEFFLSKGFENFAWYGMRGVFFSECREAAFVRALQEHGKRVERHICSPLALKGVYSDKPSRFPSSRQLGRWLEKLPKPVAVFCCNDLLAYHLSQTATGLGLNIPNDVSVLGADNDTLLCSFAPIAISSINVDASRVGSAAAQILHAILTDPPREKPHRPFLIQPKGIVERESTSFTPIGPPWFSSILSAIDNNIANGISTADVVSLSGFSATHVERLFHAKFGKSIQAYITEHRMTKAQVLLQTSELSVKEIAFACGYRSTQYFCRAFKSHFDATPTSFLHPHPRVARH